MTTRRQFVRGAGTASLLLCMPAIARRSDAQPAGNAPLRRTDLATPDFAALRASAQFDACIRPHRTGGVRLSLETFQGGPRYIIHNYGHSGAGITLSFGCASVVVDYVETVMNLRRGSTVRTSVAILGSGVIGLTTATELRRKWPQLPITIFAKGASGSTAPDVTATTSFKAGGQFEPSIIIDEYRGSNRALLTAYLRASAKRIREIEATRHAADFGIAPRKNYTFDDPNLGFDEFIPPDVVPSYRQGPLPFSEMRNSDGTRQVGREYSTWLINPRILLPKLAADLAARNVPRRVMTFENQQQVASLSETIIINCTGLGAKALFGDNAMVPKRGLLVRLPNARQRFSYLFSGGCENNRISYMFARQTDLVIGGTVKDNEESEVVSQHDRDVCGRLIDNIERVFNGHSDQCVVAEPPPNPAPPDAPPNPPN
jgi:D-amino-acid oxidase